MMRRSALLAVPLLLMAHSAQTQGVVLCSNCTTEVTAVLDAAAVAANWVTQLERMTQQIQYQLNIFQSLSGHTNVNGIVGILNQAGNFNQMAGFGNVVGQLTGGNGVGAGYLNANGGLLPVGSSIPLVAATTTVFNQRAWSLANLQGMSAEMMTNSNVIMNGLMALQQEIDRQPSAQTMLGINSRLSAYQGNINTQQYQLAQMREFADAQRQVYDQRLKLASYCADYSWANATHSLTGAGPVVGAADCHTGGGAAAPVATLPAPPAPSATLVTAGFDTPVAGN